MTWQMVSFRVQTHKTDTRDAAAFIISRGLCHGQQAALEHTAT